MPRTTYIYAVYFWSSLECPLDPVRHAPEALFTRKHEAEAYAAAHPYRHVYRWKDGSTGFATTHARPMCV